MCDKFSIKILKLIKCMLIVIFLFPLQGLANQPASSNITKVDGPNDNLVEVSLETDKSTCKIGEDINIKIFIINKSKTTIFIYDVFDFGESASISLYLFDAKTKKGITQSVIKDSITPPPSSKDDFIKLLPNYIYGVSLKITPFELGGKKNEEYELMAIYHSPIPSWIDRDINIISRENGKFSSNKVLIKIK